MTIVIRALAAEAVAEATVAARGTSNSAAELTISTIITLFYRQTVAFLTTGTMFKTTISSRTKTISSTTTTVMKVGVASYKREWLSELLHRKMDAPKKDHLRYLVPRKTMMKSGLSILLPSPPPWKAGWSK